jgi:hypothetical protein
MAPFCPSFCGTFAAVFPRGRKWNGKCLILELFMHLTRVRRFIICWYISSDSMEQCNEHVLLGCDLSSFLLNYSSVSLHLFISLLAQFSVSILQQARAVHYVLNPESVLVVTGVIVPKGSKTVDSRQHQRITKHLSFLISFQCYPC